MQRWSSTLLKFAFPLALALSVFAVGQSAFAQAYPSKPIRIIVPFPPGGPTDIYARLIGARLAESFGQPVLVENRVGGTGVVGSDAVRTAAPDGYTLLFTSNSAHVMGPMLRSPRTVDPVKDFSPVAMAIRYPMVVLINPGVQARTIQEFAALAKASPGKLNYSSVGIGSGGHLACELFNIVAGTEIVHVPYKGAAPAQAALVAGEAQMMCDSIGFSGQFITAGKLRGLALTSDKRLAAAPDIPTLKEAGFPGMEAYIWLGLLGPPNLPPAIVSKLNGEVVKFMSTPEMRERVLKGGSEVMAGTPEQFANDMRAEEKVWLRVIKEKGIKAE